VLDWLRVGPRKIKFSSLGTAVFKYVEAKWGWRLWKDSSYCFIIKVCLRNWKQSPKFNLPEDLRNSNDVKDKLITVLRRVEHNSIVVDFPAVCGSSFSRESEQNSFLETTWCTTSANTQTAKKPHGSVVRFCDSYFRSLRFNLGPGFG